MELDELKTAWKVQSQALDKSMRLNAELFARMNLGNVESRLRGTARGVIFQLAMDAIALLLVASFAADSIADLRYFIPAIVLAVFAIVLLADAASQLVHIYTLDYDEPVVSIQQRLLRLRERRLKRFMWTLAVAPLMWVPLAIVGLRALFGIDVYAAFGPVYVAANFAFGLAVLIGAIVLSRSASHRFVQYPRAQAFLDDISGRSLSRALESLDSLRRFAIEETPASGAM